MAVNNHSGPEPSNPELDQESRSVVLVIHQDDEVADACRQLLEKHGYEVAVAHSGNEGVQKIYQGIPDVVLVGGAVPELNGFQICRLIKNDSVMGKIPVLLLANMSQKIDRFWGMKAGADDFLQDDEIETKLLKKVQTVLEVYGRMDIQEKHQLRLNNEQHPFNIRTRLNQILDASLVGSTLMAEFRSLADLVHDMSLLNYMLFSLLESLLEYDAAAIFFNDAGKGPRLLTVHLPEAQALPTTSVEALMEDFFARLQFEQLGPDQLETVESEIIGNIDEEASPADYQTRHLKEVYVDGKLIGAFCLYSEQTVDYNHIFPVRLIEDEIRLLMKLRHMFSQAEMLAVTDSLTGLFNHRHFMNTLQREFKSSKRYEVDLSLGVIGVDNFRQINEEWGHACGDEILRHLSRIAEQTFRNVDILARFGGKHLTVVFPKTPADQARIALERFQQKVLASPLEWHDEARINLSVSCGLTALTPEMQSMSDLIRHGEEALQQARAQGRNRIEISRL